MLRRTTLALCIALALNASTQATGIPVVDVASITQMVVDSAQRAKEFTRSISEARNRLNQLKSQAAHYKSMVEGHYGFEEILSDPDLNSVIDLNTYSDLYDAVGDISDLRSEFDLYSDDPLIQRRYDLQLKQLRFQEMLYERSTKRNERMSRLLSQFGSATTPAAKEDLANSINFETMQMQNEQHMMDSISDMLERQKTLEAQQRSLKLKHQIFGDGIPLKEVNDMKAAIKTLPLVLVLLTACSEEAKTVDYYSQHLDEAKQVLADCKNDARKKNSDCENAAKAVSKDLKNKVFGGGIKLKKE